MSLYLVGGTWYLYIVHNGQRIRRSTETSDRKIAQQIHDEFRAELWKTKPSSSSFYGAIEAWKKDGCGDSDKHQINKLKALYEDRPLHAVTAESLVEALPASSPGTFNRYVNMVTAILNKARKAGHIEVIPHIPRKKDLPSRIRWITPDEWKRLYKALPKHLKPLARFALATGLRQHNVTHLEWSQVDLTRRVAWIHPDQAKARRAIGIPLSDEAIAVLRAQKGEHDVWVFPYRGKPLAKIKRAWREALSRAKIDDFTWHDLRHTWASWHVQRGTPLQALKEMGGWASMQMVFRYAHLAPEHLAQYANNSKPRHSLRHSSKKKSV